MNSRPAISALVEVVAHQRQHLGLALGDAGAVQQLGLGHDKPSCMGMDGGRPPGRFQSAYDERLAVRDGDCHPVRPGRAFDVTKRKLMLPQPGRESILVAPELDPVDADRGAPVLDEFATRVVPVIDEPLDEEGKAVAHRRVQGHQATVLAARRRDACDASREACVRSGGPGPRCRRCAGTAPRAHRRHRRVAVSPTNRADWNRPRRCRRPPSARCNRRPVALPDWRCRGRGGARLLRTPGPAVRITGEAAASRSSTRMITWSMANTPAL